jgi:two-component system sensor histidine kinase KdpD
VLHGYSRDIVAADNAEAMVPITSEALAALFEVPAVAVLVADNKVVLPKRVGSVEPNDAELETARSSLATGTAVRAGTYPDVASRFDFWPVATAGGPCAVIGLAFDPDERPSAPSEIVDVVGSVLALALERQHSQAGGEARARPMNQRSGGASAPE